MFINNKYHRWYYNLIELAKSRKIIGYKEKHHIIPKSLGGTDSRNNIVELTAREHFLCHFMLTKMTSGSDRSKMIRAFWFMKTSGPTHHRYMNSTLYESLRINFSKVMSKSQSGKNNSQYGKIWVSNVTLKKSIKIDKDKLEEYLENGWVRKRIIDFSKSIIVSRPPFTRLSQLQRFRLSNGLSTKIPDSINGIKMFHLMTKSLKNMGFNFLSQDLENEFQKFRNSFYQEHIVDNTSFPVMSRKYNLIIHSIEKVFKNIGIPQKSKIIDKEYILLSNLHPTA